MNKIKLLLIATLISTPMLNAFAGDDEGGKKGIRAGYQMSNFYTDGNQNAENLNSFYLGVFGEKKLIPLLRLGTGVEYSSTGMTSNAANLESKYVRHAISVPVYLKLKLGPVYALGGAAANFGVSNNFTVNDEKVDLTDDQKTNVFNLPVYLGVGVKILMFSIEARYHMGTMDLNKDDNITETNQYLQLGAAVSF